MTTIHGLAAVLLLVTSGLANAQSGKLGFDPGAINDNGLYGPANGLRAMSYEFCVPNRQSELQQVRTIDPSITGCSRSRGRIGCREDQRLCIGHTHQPEFRCVLRRLTELDFVERIEPAWFE